MNEDWRKMGCEGQVKALYKQNQDLEKQLKAMARERDALCKRLEDIAVLAVKASLPKKKT